jgi:hypothetical protein
MNRSNPVKYLAILCLALITGCGAAYHVTVYGTTGKQYIAPDLCAAVIQCETAKEPTCRYNVTTVTSADGKTFERDMCKTAK